MANVKELIAEGLLDGADEAALRQKLVEAGASPAKADYELKRLEKDPYASALLRASRRIAKRDWTLGLYGKLAGERAEGLTIPTTDNPQPADFFEQFYAANLPVKLTGLVDHWDALDKWDLDYLDAKVGAQRVEMQERRESEADYELDKGRHRNVVPMKEIIARLKELGDTPSNDFYVTAYNDSTNKRSLAALWDDLGPVSILQASGQNDGFFWLGPKGTLTPFHHDLTNNLLVQVKGRKKVRMVPSWDVARMRNFVHCFSGREPTDWDVEDPALPPLLETTIGPGEAIFLPIGWWHHVEALDLSISMSFTNFAADNDFLSGYPSDSRF
ncbi:cupin-like domain-containing protein [Sphingomicrobium sediminis]|uniref:Cupin-like domain-containing protein n=1 Tax=Sphingomicrobium sediminis TaxID=2950949 RepID=A0A9X2EM26_9SPHN|nr:cupin-like domain-containing protein [Sphingomicrobium sediminis]MCM8557867.1 cupin-like domain-containing protein [Sphingomicrobium sediminis]